MGFNKSFLISLFLSILIFAFQNCAEDIDPSVYGPAGGTDSSSTTDNTNTNNNTNTTDTSGSNTSAPTPAPLVVNVASNSLNINEMQSVTMSITVNRPADK